MTLKEIIRLKMNSKVSSFGGGSGNHTHAMYSYTISKSESLRQKIYNADYIIMSSREGIEIYKNRLEEDIGFVSSERFIEIMLQMLAKKLYNGLTEVFQEGFITEAKKALERVLEEHSKAERIKD